MPIGARRPLATLLAASLGIVGPARADDAALERARRAAVREPTPGHLCDLGLAYAAADEPARALLHLARCPADRTSPALRETQARAARAARALELGLVSISSEPAGAAVVVSTLAGDPPLTTPVEVHLARGRHRVHVTAADHQPFAIDVEVSGRERQAIFARLPPVAATTAAPVTTADFLADAPAAADGVMTVPDPRPKKHAPLLPERFRGPAPTSRPRLVDPDGRADGRAGRADDRSPWPFVAGGVAGVAALVVLGLVIRAR